MILESRLAWRLQNDPASDPKYPASHCSERAITLPLPILQGTPSWKIDYGR